MFRYPALGLAEVCWRWSLGAAGFALVIAAALEYLDNLVVNPADIFFLRSRQPLLAEKALVHIFRGSGLRAAAVFLILAAGFAVAWTIVGALGRLAILREIFGELRNQGVQNSGDNSGELGSGGMGALMGLNFLRVAMTVAAWVGLAGALLLPGMKFRGGVLPPGSAALLVLWIVLLLWLAWSFLNWFLSLASVFVVGEGRHTFGAIRGAVDLCRSRPGAVFGVGAWFGLAHLGILGTVGSVIGTPLSMAGFVPGGIVVVLLCGMMLVYFAAVDFLYVGRLTAYAAIMQWPELPSVTASPGFRPPASPVGPAEGAGRVDQDERILGDLPLPDAGLPS